MPLEKGKAQTDELLISQESTPPTTQKSIDEFESLIEECVAVIVEGLRTRNVTNDTCHDDNRDEVTTNHEAQKNKKRKKRSWKKKKNLHKHKTFKKPKVTHDVTTAVTPVLTRPYLGNLPKCNECSFHHNGICRELICDSCNLKGHTTRFCRKSVKRTTKTTKARNRQGQAKKRQTAMISVPTTSTTQTTTRPYSGTLPKCSRCPFHHKGQCREIHCTNCNLKGHTARSCRLTTTRLTQQSIPRHKRKNRANQACYGCGEIEHFRRNCPKAENNQGSRKDHVLNHGTNEA